MLEEGATPDASEFTKNERRLPLPSVTVKAAAALPPHDQLWAWAHVHTNLGYNQASEFEQFLHDFLEWRASRDAGVEDERDEPLLAESA